MKKLIALIAALLILLSMAGCTGGTPAPVSAPREESEFSIIFLDVGQADCALITCDGERMLIDGGNVDDSQLVVSWLRGLGVDFIDYVVCTHAHEDHCGGLPAVMSNFEAGCVFSPVTERDVKFFNNFVKYTEEQGLQITVPEAGDTFSLGSSAVTVIGPVKDYDDINETSIVLRIVYGETSFLFTGDAGRESENDILDSGAELESTLLKVGHHGSSGSTTYTFLREVMPEYAVISCGVDNDYGHPHEEALSRLRDANVTLYRTDLQGTVTCVSDGKELTFETESYAAVTNPTLSDGSGQNSENANYYIGNKNSHVYHLPTCASLPAEQNQVIFETLEDALSAGYTPCSRCVG